MDCSQYPSFYYSLSTCSRHQTRNQRRCFLVSRSPELLKKGFFTGFTVKISPDSGSSFNIRSKILAKFLNFSTFWMFFYFVFLQVVQLERSSQPESSSRPQNWRIWINCLINNFRRWTKFTASASCGPSNSHEYAPLDRQHLCGTYLAVPIRYPWICKLQLRSEIAYWNRYQVL